MNQRQQPVSQRHNQKPRTSSFSARPWLLAAALGPLFAACGVETHLEPYKQTDVVVSKGEQLVVLARKQHSNHEAEEGFVQCISDALAKGDSRLEVHSTKAFEDSMYPWFEPSTAPLSTDDLSRLLEKPEVMQQVKNTGVRYVVWLDGSTDRVASGGGITCAAGIGGAGCMGLAWWEDDSRYDATVWDIKQAESAGTIHADVKGRSVMPAIIIPIPLIARPQAAACRGLTQQLKQFLTSPHGYGAGPEPGIG
jgi:hypothetical protein